MENSQEQLVRYLVNLSYPLVEVTFLDKNGHPEEILNPFSTLKEDQECDIKKAAKDTLFLETLTNGRCVRGLVLSRHNRQKLAGYLRLRYDLTVFKTLQEQISQVIQGTNIATAPEQADSWKTSVTQAIATFLAEHKINIRALSPKQKRELIAKLQSKGLLDFKEASTYVAAQLQVSRATVYNYLKTTADLKKVHIHQVDTFTTERFGGNPAGVVLDGSALDEATMRKITRELNLSETAFVLPDSENAFRIRYFTPTGHELVFCGHSTVGALYMIAKERRFGVDRDGTHSFDVSTLCGTLKMEVTVRDEKEIHVAYEAPSIKLRKTDITHEAVAKAAGFDLGLVDDSLPVMFEETNKDLFVAVRSLKGLKKIECDSKSLTQFSKLHDVVALCIFTTETYEKKNHFHMRCFAPRIGIPEDPFTGSVLGGLTAYADMLGLLPKSSRSFRVEQGHCLKRPGVVSVKFTKNGECYQAKVYAEAVHCFSTEIDLA